MDKDSLARTHADLFAHAQGLPAGEWGVIESDSPASGLQLRYRAVGGRDIQLQVVNKATEKLVVQCDWMGYDYGIHYGAVAVRRDERAPVATNALMLDFSTGTVRFVVLLHERPSASFTLHDGFAKAGQTHSARASSGTR